MNNTTELKANILGLLDKYVPMPTFKPARKDNAGKAWEVGCLLEQLTHRASRGEYNTFIIDNKINMGTAHRFRMIWRYLTEVEARETPACTTAYDTAVSRRNLQGDTSEAKPRDSMIQYVTLKDLAREVGLDRSNLRKYIIANDVDMVKIRTAESKNQATLAVTQDTADYIRELRTAQGFQVLGNSQPLAEHGFLYIVLIDKEARADRYKIGFTTSIDKRLATYRTTSPHVETTKRWRCRRSWEAAAACALTNSRDVVRVTGEIFDIADIAAVVHCGDRFFALMPSEE